MQQRIKSILVFIGAIGVFLSIYQILLLFLTNEDGISITLISSSSPYWAYFIDGYHIIYTFSWFAVCSFFWLFSSSFLLPIKRNKKVKYRVYSLGYNILLYAIGLYILSKLTVAGMELWLIPCILSIILFGIIYIVHQTNIK